LTNNPSFDIVIRKDCIFLSKLIFERFHVIHSQPLPDDVHAFRGREGTAMLLIKSEQMKVLEQYTLCRFEDEMIAHGKEFAPRLSEQLGDDQLRVAVHSIIKRAMDYGFTNRGPIRLCIEMMFLFGSGFDSDVQYEKAGAYLRDTGDQMVRAEKMRQYCLDYLEKVSGPKSVNVHRSLKGLWAFAKGPMNISADHFVTDLLGAMRSLFPQKTAYVGDNALTELIQEGRSEAAKYHFDTLRGEALMVVLMFSFGHGCTNDPLYPWIARNLQDERIIDASGRAARLEKKALTWLEHVIAGNEKKEKA
jgi:hypothetical protein